MSAKRGVIVESPQPQPSPREQSRALARGDSAAHTADARRGLHASNARQDLLLLLATFVSFRVLAVLFLKPGGEVYLGGHDIGYYWQMAELSLDGYYPYLNYWMEYPPLFPWVLIGLYRLSLLLPSWPSPILWFQVAVGLFLVLCEVGNLVLVYSIARRVHGEATALRVAWVYGALFLPLYSLTNWLDAFPLFFLLLAVRLTLAERPLLAGLAVGTGFMVKVIPAVVAPACLLAWRRWRGRALFVAAATAVVMLVALPFALANQAMFVASFRSMVMRSSWLTPWALWEGYFDVGYAPTLAARFEATSADWQVHPQTLPLGWLWVGLGASYLLLFSRRLAWREPRVLLAASALSLNLLLLFSKGYSPQFLLYALALLVTVLPGPWGLAYALLLTFNSFVEWPLAAVYFRDEHWLWWAVVLFRTLVLSLLCWEYLVVLDPRLRLRWEPVRRRAAWPAGVTLAALAVAGAVVLAGRYVGSGEQYQIASYVKALAAPGQVVITSNRETFYRLKAYFPDDRLPVPRDEVWQDDKSLLQSAADATEGASQAWLVLDHSSGDAARLDLLTQWFDNWGSRATDVWFGSYQLLGYVPYGGLAPGLARGSQVEFGGQLALLGWQSPAGPVEAGTPWRVTLLWGPLGASHGDYKVFVHVLDEAGRLVAQADRPLAFAGKPSSAWQEGTQAREVYDLTVPADSEAAGGTIEVGLYDANSGKRLSIVDNPAGGDAFSIGRWQRAERGDRP